MPLNGDSNKHAFVGWFLAGLARQFFTGCLQLLREAQTTTVTATCVATVATAFFMMLDTSPLSLARARSFKEVN